MPGADPDDRRFPAAGTREQKQRAFRRQNSFALFRVQIGIFFCCQIDSAQHLYPIIVSPGLRQQSGYLILAFRFQSRSIKIWTIVQFFQYRFYFLASPYRYLPSVV